MRVFDGKVLNTNSKGLRGNTEYDYQRIPGKHRVVVLGDSFTFGTEVSDKETYSHYLESALPNTEVLNFGVQGYGQDQMLLYLQEEGIKYKPDVVVVGYVAMDTHRNLLKFFGYAKPKFNLLSSRLELTDVPVPTPDQVLAREPYRSKAVDLLLILHERLRWRLGKNEAEARELARAILDEIVATTRQAGAVPVIVYLPVNEEIVRPDVSMDVQELDLYDYCQNRGIPCLFPRQQIHEKLETGDDFRLHGHWNAMTHELAAREIADFVIRKGLIQSISSAAAQR